MDLTAIDLNPGTVYALTACMSVVFGVVVSGLALGLFCSILDRVMRTLK